MKRRTWSSVAPSRSITRICSRRSSARLACESASVWFWQTRQRSSAAITITRASSAGSALAGAASFALAHVPALAPSAHINRAMKNLRIAKTLQKRADLRRDQLRRQRPDQLEAHDALLVDHEGLGHAVDAEVDAHAALLVEERHGIRVAETREPAEAFFSRVFVVQADDRHRARLREAHERRVLGAAGLAPRGPDVEHPDLAEHVVAADGARGVVEARQRERRRRLVDQRRGHLARVELQP